MFTWGPESWSGSQWDEGWAVVCSLGMPDQQFKNAVQGGWL